jgi:hypothetical protein
MDTPCPEMAQSRPHRRAQDQRGVPPCRRAGSAMRGYPVSLRCRLDQVLELLRTGRTESARLALEEAARALQVRRGRPGCRRRSGTGARLEPGPALQGVDVGGTAELAIARRSARRGRQRQVARTTRPTAACARLGAERGWTASMTAQARELPMPRPVNGDDALPPSLQAMVAELQRALLEIGSLAQLGLEKGDGTNRTEALVAIRSTSQKALRRLISFEAAAVAEEGWILPELPRSGGP